MRGNPNFIASSWGEETRPVKLPLRMADRIRQLREQGLTCDDFLNRLDSGVSKPVVSSQVLAQVVGLLEGALTLRANTGGAIKDRIRQALQLLV